MIAKCYLSMCVRLASVVGLLVTVMSATAAEAAARQFSVTYIRPFGSGETVELFRGRPADLVIETGMARSVDAVTLRLTGSGAAAVPLPGASVEFLSGQGLPVVPVRVRVQSGPGTPLGAAILVLIGVGFEREIPIRFTDVGEISSIEFESEPLQLNVNMVVTLQGHGLDRIAFCGNDVMGAPTLNSQLTSVGFLERTPTRARLVVRPKRIGPLEIGTDAFRDQDVSYCPGAAMPWGDANVRASTHVQPNPRPTAIVPTRARAGAWVRIEGTGFFEQTSMYDIGVSYRAVDLPSTHAAAFGGPLPIQRAAGDALEFQIPQDMRDAELELTFSSLSQPSFRVPVPGRLLVDHAPQIEDVNGADAEVLVPGRVLEIHGSDLLDRDGQAAIRLGAQEFAPDAASQSHGGSYLRLTLPADVESYEGVVGVVHDGGSAASARHVTVAGAPFIEAVQQRVQQQTWCESGQPVATGSETFGPLGAGLARGHDHRIVGRNLRTIAAAEPRVFIGQTRLNDVSIAPDHIAFTLPFDFAGADGATELRVETAAGQHSIPLLVRTPTALGQVSAMYLQRGDPPEPTSVFTVLETDPASPGGAYAGEIVLDGWPGPSCGLPFQPPSVRPPGYAYLGMRITQIGERLFFTLAGQVDQFRTVSVGVNFSKPPSPSAALNLRPHPAEPRAITPELAGAIGGDAVSMAVAVDYRSNEGRLTVTSSDPAVVSVPSTLAANAASVSFQAQTRAVEAPTTVTITVSGRDRSVSTELRVTPEPIRFESLTIVPTTAIGGELLEGTIRISGMTAQTPPIDVRLSSSDKAIDVPVSVKVSDGVGRFKFTTSIVERTTRAVIEAQSAHGGGSVALTLAPLSVSNAAVSKSPARLGETVTLTVTLNGAAPSDLPLQLAISDPSAVTAPTATSIKPGQRTVEIPLSVRRDAPEATVSIEVLLPGQSSGRGSTVELRITR